jgi:hypothetical protein
MTTGPLALLLPTSSRWGRRGLGLVTSVVAHATFALILVTVVRAPSRRPVRPPPPVDKKMVWVTPVAAPPPVQVDRPVLKVAAPVMKASKPIEYAAAPAGLKPSRDWKELLPRALALQAQGLNAPSFVIENLDVSLVATLAARGLAMIVAGRPPFDHDARQVHWTEAGPTDVGALPAAWTQHVARRAIVLPRAWVTTVMLAPEEQVYVLITTDLDAAILAAQLAAAEQRGVALSALVRTHGRLLPTADGILAFHIDAVDLHS